MDDTTNISPLNFNSQLNVASILSHLDDEDLKAIEAELLFEDGTDLQNLNPNLKEWYLTLGQNRSETVKRQIINHFHPFQSTYGQE